jgi:putative ABC transport system permease protein
VFLFNLRIACRTLSSRAAGFTLVVVATMALGLGANLALFAMLSELLWKPLPFPDPDRIVALFGVRADKGETGVAWLDVRDWEQTTRSFSALGVYRDRTFLLAGPPNTVITAGMVSAGFFTALAIQPSFGRAMVPADEHAGNNHVVWLGDALWRNRFQRDRSVIGKTLRLNEEPYSIAGVLPAFAFQMRGKSPDLYFPLDESDYGRRRGGGGVSGIGRVSGSIETARSDLETAAAALAAQYPATNRHYSAGLRPLREHWIGSRATPLWLLFGAAGLLFAITAVNVANVLVARSLASGRETSIRVSLGASAGQLFQQRLIEAGLLAALSSIAAFGVAAAVLRGAAHVDWRTGIFAAALAAALTLGLGLVSFPRRTYRQSRLRRVLVTSEIALSFGLLLAAGLLLHGLWDTLQISPGFDPRQVLTVGIGIPEIRYNTDAKMAVFYEQAIGRLAALPRVEFAAAGAWLPMTGTLSGRYQREDRALPSEQRPVASRGVVSPAYFAALRIPVLQGREFSPEDRIGHPAVCVINRALAQAAFPGEGAIGKRLIPDIEGVACEIVGIVADSHQVSLEQPPLPQFFLSLYQFPAEGLRFILRTPATPVELTPAVRAAVASVDPNLEQVTPAPMSRFIDNSVANRRWAAILLASFALVALLVTALGMFGLIAFQVARRSKEIGIRMAVGATPRSIVTLVLSEGAALLLVGLLIGSALSMAFLRIFGHAFAISGSDPAAQVAAVLALACAGMLASWLPARRASRLDPLTVLRQD